MPVPARAAVSQVEQVKPGRAHVLDAGDGAGGEQFQARFAHELLHERIADLHRAALLLRRFLGQILRGKRRPGQTIATRGRADVEHRIANALGRAARDLFVAQHAQAKRVHQRIAFVGFIEINLAGDRSGCRSNCRNARCPRPRR